MATELASGYISLTVKYQDAMKQINKDFTGVAATAQRAGTQAGQSFSQGVTRSTATASQSVNGVFKGASTQADSAGRQAGAKFGSGFKSGIGSMQIAIPTQQINAQADTAGRQAGSKFGAAMKMAVKAAGITAVIGGVASVLTAGFSRLQAIDDARFKLQALGHDAQNVQTIMDNALASVKGTAFGLGDAATAAASAVAAGIKPGQELTKYLTLTGDAAAVAGTSFEEMGAIFNKVQTANVAFTDDLRMLSDRGIPIFQWLSREMGVTQEALNELVTEGKVDAATFQRAIEHNIGGAAQKMGQSFSGSLENAKAAIGRLGASLLGPVFEKLPGLLEKVTGWIDKFKASLAGGETQGWIKGLGDAFRGIGAAWTTHFAPALKELWAAIKGPLADLGKQFVETFKESLPILKTVGVIIGGALLAAIKALTFILPIALKLWQMFFKAVQFAAIEIKEAWNNMMFFFNQAKSGWAGLVSAFNTGKDIIGDIWNGIKDAISGAWSVIEPVWDAFKAAFEVVAVAAMDLWQNAIVPAWEGIKSAVQTGWEFIKGIFEDIKGGFQGVADFIKGVWSGIGSAISGALDGAISALKGPLHTIGSVLASMPDSVFGVDIPGAAAAKSFGERLQALRRGGAVRGPGGDDNVLAWLTAGEGVINKQAMLNGGSEIMAALNAGWVPPPGLLRAMLPGFGAGGTIGELDRVIQIATSQFGLSAGSGRRNEPGSFHNTGEAIDINAPGNDPAMLLAFAKYMYANFGSNLAELIFDHPGMPQLIKNGKPVPSSFYGGSDHLDHVHVAVRAGTQLAPGGADLGGVPTVPLTQTATGAWTSPNAAWAALIARESGGRNIRQGITDANSGGNEAEGIFQITPGTWKAYGGTEFAPNPLAATPEQQAIVAARILHRNPSGGDWGAGMPGRENAADLLAGLTPTGGRPAASAAASTATESAAADNPYVKLMEALKEILPDPGALADIAAGGLKENLIPGFSDPTEWPNVKSLAALLKSVGILSGNPQFSSVMGAVSAGLGGSGSGVVAGIEAAVGPQGFGLGNPAGPGFTPGAPQTPGSDNTQPLIHIENVHSNGNTDQLAAAANTADFNANSRLIGLR